MSVILSAPPAKNAGATSHRYTGNTTNTADQTLLSVSGAGRIAYLEFYIGGSGYGFFTVKVDGATLINGLQVGNNQFLSPLNGGLGVPNTSTNCIPLADFTFNSSFVVIAHSSVSTTTAYVDIGYETA